nr:kinesin-like protein KIF25 [Symphalangus syndactylus]
MPAGSGRWGGFWEQRTRQLQSQVWAKEDKIAELETENAVLLLKLAEYKGNIERSRSEARGFPPCTTNSSVCRETHAQP